MRLWRIIDTRKVGAGETAFGPNTALQGTLRDKVAQRP